MPILACGRQSHITALAIGLSIGWLHQILIQAILNVIHVLLHIRVMHFCFQTQRGVSVRHAAFFYLQLLVVADSIQLLSFDRDLILYFLLFILKGLDESFLLI